MTRFARYIGIDYSGAKTADSSLPGLRVYLAEAGQDEPRECLPPPGRRKYWSRRGLAAWLTDTLRDASPTLVGIDHGFSFPLAYFEQHRLPLDWPFFLDDFRRHWPTDEEQVCVDSIRRGVYGNAAARSGDRRWRRLTEQRAGSAKSVFHFDVQGSVAKSTHAGLPWLYHLRRALGTHLHGWPFDGWQPPEGCSVIAEVYPRLWNRLYPGPGRSSHQQDAYAVARWMQEADRSEVLEQFWQPPLSPPEREIARVEGWILGVGAASDSAAGT
ncbi:MAG: hypothetical protein RMN25_04880 [Anaerolineae bacterium]|nr:hypothetical protein [Thermoflexales bacterium]MDW8407099.1 hypothetical protein [Anaerolineae bacterium]